MELSAEHREALISTLQARFEKNMKRHPNLQWAQVQARIDAHPEKLASLHAMESTGGEPDVVAHDPATGAVHFYDCAAESPKDRRSLCYDRQALDARKANKPKGCATDQAADMGITLLTETQYRALQKVGNFDTKTSSWIQTPEEIRKLGGALFADHRYGTVFVYHNGADSYYGSRGFRGALIV